jgi:hypothetical protein
MTTEYYKSKISNFFTFNLKTYLIGILIISGCFLLPKIALQATVDPQSIIDLTNKQRQGLGLEQLKLNDLLTKAANEKAKALFKSQTFAHNLGSKKFSAWIKDAGYDYLFVGENLAINFDNSEDIMQAWLNSPLHKKNLLNPVYQDIGVATLSGVFEENESTLVVQIFGTPLLSPAKLEDNLFPAAGQIYSQAKTYSNENLLTHSLSPRFAQDQGAIIKTNLASQQVYAFDKLLNLKTYFNAEGFELVTVLFKIIFLYFFLFAYLLFIFDLKRIHL